MLSANLDPADLSNGWNNNNLGFKEITKNNFVSRFIDYISFLNTNSANFIGYYHFLQY